MSRFTGRILLTMACLTAAAPAIASAGSTQANLTVAVVVPARCALRVVGALPSREVGLDRRDDVVMKCTRGTLPPADRAVASRPSAAGPRITHDIILGSAPAVTSAPRPLADQGAAVIADGGAPRLVITVNF
jgi:hypothetical protein